MNESLFDAIFQFAHQSPLLDGVGVFCAAYLQYFVVIGLFALLFAWRVDWRLKLFVGIEAVLVVVIARGIVAESIKVFIDSARPFVALGVDPLFMPSSQGSFPSGHAAFFFSLAFALFFTQRTWAWWYLGAAAIIGIARVFAGVHWPIDIVGGALIGLAIAALVHFFVQDIYEKLAHR